MGEVARDKAINWILYAEVGRPWVHGGGSPYSRVAGHRRHKVQQSLIGLSHVGHDQTLQGRQIRHRWADGARIEEPAGER